MAAANDNGNSQWLFLFLFLAAGAAASAVASTAQRRDVLAQPVSADSLSSNSQFKFGPAPSRCMLKFTKILDNTTSVRKTSKIPDTTNIRRLMWYKS